MIRFLLVGKKKREKKRVVINTVALTYLFLRILRVIGSCIGGSCSSGVGGGGVGAVLILMRMAVVRRFLALLHALLLARHHICSKKILKQV